MTKFLDIVKRFVRWLGFGQSIDEHNAVARRNAPIIVIGGIVAALFTGMLLFYLITGAPCPINGFDNAVRESPAARGRYTVFCTVATAIMLALSVFFILYVRRSWRRPGIAAILSFVFSLVFVMIWGVADSGRPPDNQVLIFASIQFLIAGLIIFHPIESVVYFVVSFSLFGLMLGLYGEAEGHGIDELSYLATLDIVVSWIVYGLFQRGVRREQVIADMSRRDELTGAKNRHYLRDDVDALVGSQLFVMICDIDDFKRYNDEIDHDAGDELLREFCYALRDAYGDECTYRYGGDEFLIVSPDVSVVEFQRKAARCAKQIESVRIAGRKVGLTFSGGYSYGTMAKVEDFRGMLHEADKALLEVKRTGKKRVSGYEFQAPESE